MKKYHFMYLVGFILLNTFLLDVTGKLMPKLLKTEVGQQAKFLCKVESNVKWSFNGHSLPPNAQEGKLNKNTYYIFIPKVQVGNRGIYTCTGLYNGRHIESSGNLIIKIKGELRPPDLYRKVGEVAIFKCDADDDVKWSFNGGPIRPNIDVGELDSYSYYLQIHKVTEGDGGTYTCESEYNGIHKISSGQLIIEETGKLMPELWKAEIAQQAKFLCRVESNVKWSFNGGTLPPNAQEGRLDANTHYLFIPRVQVGNKGIYTCTGLYNGESIQSSGKLVIETKGQLKPPELYRKVGELAIFECEAENNVIWSFNDGPLRPNMDVQKVDSDTNYIYIRKVTEDDEGTYTCKGEYNGVYKVLSGELIIEREESFSSSLDVEKRCPSLDLHNGEVSLQNNDMKTAIYRCSVGYKLNGPIQRQCEDGQWSGNAPTCERASSFQLLYAKYIDIYTTSCAILITNF